MEATINTNLLSGLEETARRAFNWISFDPDKRGARTLQAYNEELTSDVEQIKKWGEQYGQDSGRAVERYIQKYKAHLTAWFHSQSRTASSAITGGSNFPVHRQEKLHRWADNKYEEFREYRTRVLNAIHKGFKPKITPQSELDKARADLKEREELQVRMKAVNAIIKKGKDVVAKIQVLGYSEEKALELSGENRFGYKGYASFSLTNNNAQIKRLKTRVQELESKQAKAETGNKEHTINGVRIIENFEADRLQLFFDGKPAEKILNELRGSWNWSPAGKCWQRKITGNAYWHLKNCVLKAIENNLSDAIH